MNKKINEIRKIENGILNPIIVLASLSLLLFNIACNNPGKIETWSDDKAGLQHKKEFGNVVSLNGTWEVEEGNMENVPEAYSHTADVPGLLKTATPAFEGLGLPSDKRDAFYYRKKVKIEKQQDEVVCLKINKAKYTTKLFVNGQEVGYNPLNFTPSVFNITEFVKNGDENEIVIRIGDHIEQVPDTTTNGSDVEKHAYYPGIYDEVVLIYTSKCNLDNVQIVPDIDSNKVSVVLYINNLGKTIKGKKYNLSISDPKTNKVLASKKIDILSIKENTKSEHEVDITFNNYGLWSPESPKLYNLIVSDENYSSCTKFGMRKIQIDKNYPNKALLNNRQYFFRGTNIGLFRFFEDTLCTTQPWDTAWVKKFHKRMKELHLNSLRPHGSALPEFWYDIADEEGFVIFDEFPIWYTIKPGVSIEDTSVTKKDPVRKYSIYPDGLTVERLADEYSQWMHAHWNHASLGFWDAQNETWSKEITDAINMVRDIDLSNRPWDNGWSPPASENDYREGHTYFARYNVGSEDKRAAGFKPKPFTLSELYNATKITNTFYLPYQWAYLGGKLDGHWDIPNVINEYGYLWINRDGTPTTLSKPYYDEVLGENATSDERFYHYARILATLTEYWRTNRSSFGVLFSFGLAYSQKVGATADVFQNIDPLTFYPYFEKYVADAFYPLGISIESWKDSYKPGTEEDFPIFLTNDFLSNKAGSFSIILKENDNVLSKKKYAFEIRDNEQKRRFIKLKIPDKTGEYLMIARLEVDGDTISCYRDIHVLCVNQEKTK